ncbi:DNA repair metallo-beta-lactamase family protein [Euphorbia peplus]|nr:DNA repair metallo-beta-lactamase family protein [Euphorbia peplus]
MAIEMPGGLPFSVDTWSRISNRKRHHFLTHAHKDHSSRISSHSSYPIYSTPLTKSLLLLTHPHLDNSLFVDIEVGRSVLINDPDGQFTVTPFDANHCPGAVMFLFEGNFGNILHTGDCRLTLECLQCLPEKYVGKNGKEPRCRLDCVFLDCTFGSSHQTFPSKNSATQQVINCIWKHPSAAVVYLTCDLLGQENILADVSRAFGSKIYVDKAINPECFDSLTLTAPHILSQNPSSRFHLLGGFPKLHERAAAKFAEAKANFEPQPLIIRPSTQWYACDADDRIQNKRRYNEAVRDDCGIWHVCYSIHSSREELEWALKLLAPSLVVSTTPSCRAIELDYVRKKSAGGQLSKDDRIWKLLDISWEASSEVDVSVHSINYPPAVEGPSHNSAVNTSHTLLSLSPPSKRPPVTLFGRARLWISGSNFLDEEEIAMVTKSSPTIANNIDGEATVEVKCEHKEYSEKLLEKEHDKVNAHSPIDSSRKLSDCLIKLYRSTNVSVPRPPPSLQVYTEQKKRRIEFLS